MNQAASLIRCPVCSTTLRVPLPQPAQVLCPKCDTRLRLTPTQHEVRTTGSSKLPSELLNFEELPPHDFGRLLPKQPQPRDPQSATWLTVVRIIAGCIGVICVCAPVVSIWLATIDTTTHDGSGSTRSLTFIWIAVLVGIPALLIALKGISVDARSMRIRRGGVLMIVGGIGLALLAGLITYMSFLLDTKFGMGGGIVAIGLLISGVIMTYVGVMTAIIGIDLKVNIAKHG